MKPYLLLLGAIPFLMADSCETIPSSDTKQRSQNEVLLQEATSAIGMPGIKNFRMRRMLKEIFELCDQDGLLTYTYLENMNPTPVKGITSNGGKLTFFGTTVGYGIPYATQFTNPMKVINPYSSAITTLPQADPDGLFRPASADGTWVLMHDPTPGSNKTEPVLLEPRIVVTPFKLPVD